MLEMKVLFRKDKKDNKIICVFLEADEGLDRLGAYVHDGGHISLYYDYILKNTVNATIKERKELLQEIKNIGYYPNIQERLTKKYMEVK